MSKLLFFDLETTGVKFWRNGIHQIGMNPSFGVIMDEYGKDIFQGNLKLINVPKGVKDLIVNYIEKYRKL